MRPVVLAMNDRQVPLANEIANEIDADVKVFAPRAGDHARTYGNVIDELRECFRSHQPIVAIMAAGIIIRALAEVLTNKKDEPPVIAVSNDGRSIVPLLGGHRGANALAQLIAGACGGCPAITTAGEIAIGVALDDPPNGYSLAAGDPKAVMASVVAGGMADVDPALPWAAALNGAPSEARLRLRVDDRAEVAAAEGELVYRAERYAIGVGCERGASAEELSGLAHQVLREHDISPECVAVIASADLKTDEPAVHALARSLNRPARFLDLAELQREEHRLATPSEIVRGEVGVAGVAEAACLAAAGEAGELIVPKRKSQRCTVAISRSSTIIDPTTVGRARGRLSLVGLGPGATELRSSDAERTVREARHVVGYTLYLDLCDDIRRGERHDFPLGGEEDRVRESIRLAGEGNDVALVCSGDPGIYAMAALVYEVLDHGGCTDAEKRIAVRVVPGISALQGASALVGAPLGHDFCAISLSDLLTPWSVIERRVRSAAEGDFVVAFYNPVSRRRRTQLEAAKHLLLQKRRGDTPVVLATNISRGAEAVSITTLTELDVDQVDMLTTVLVGSSQTRVFTRGDGTRCVYTPRGYSAKGGSRIQAAQTEIAAGEIA